MFRCQFSGEVSDAAVYKTEVISSRSEEGKVVNETTRVLVSSSEKPVKVVIETRTRIYNNRRYFEDGKFEEYQTQGTEIVKELLVRPRHVAAVKAKYGQP